LKLGPGPFKAPNGKLFTGPEIDAMTLRTKDWRPSEHPPAPAIILGPARKDGPAPCAECHTASGRGLVNIPDIAGLPADYIVQQLNAFRSGERRSTQPDRLSTAVMIKVAQTATEAEMRQAAAYYAAIPRRPRIKVIEADTAPATAVERFGWSYKAASGRAQPLAGRVVEVPQSVARAFLYDPSLKQIAYVPKGSIRKGAVLVHNGGRGGQPCAACHGAGLKGAGVAPPLAGRDPSYLARMLWDIKSGARHGSSVALMQGPAGRLTPADITDVCAYIAALNP
jgi:cytochrome c553